TDFLGLLAEPVDAAFALFVACRVSGQVVMDDGGEQMLQVDAFGKAICGDKDALPGILHVFHALTALFRGELTGDGIYGGRGKGGLEVLGHVMGSGNVAAEHHGVIAIFKQGTDVPDERRPEEYTSERQSREN